MSEAGLPESTPDATPPSEPAPACALCGAAVSDGPPRFVNGQEVCARCQEQVRAELAAEQAEVRHYPVALGAGLVGSLIGAGVWAAIAIATEFEVGYVAVLVGFLAGIGVKLGAGKRRGVGLQIAAAALSLVGLLAAKYFIFAYVLVKVGREQGVDISYFDTRILEMFPQALPELVSGFDILWVILAVGAAYRLPAPSKVQVHGGD